MKKFLYSMLCLMTVMCDTGSASAQQLPPLFASIQQGDVEMIRELADSESANQILEIKGASFTPLGFSLAMLDSGMKQAERIIPLLLDKGADPNVVYNKHVLGSATDWAMAGVMMNSVDGEKSKVYESIFNLFKHYGGHVVTDRLVSIQEKFLDANRQRVVATCNGDAKNWMTAQQDFHGDKGYYPSMPTNFPCSLKLITYQYGQYSFAATLSCRLVINSNRILYNSEADMLPVFR